MLIAVGAGGIILTVVKFSAATRGSSSGKAHTTPTASQKLTTSSSRSATSSAGRRSTHSRMLSDTDLDQPSELGCKLRVLCVASGVRNASVSLGTSNVLLYSLVIQ